MPLLDRTVENRQESIGSREGGVIGKGPRDGNRTRVTASTVALYVSILTTRLLVSTMYDNYIGMLTLYINNVRNCFSPQDN